MQNLKALKLISHITGWLIFFSLPIVFMNEDGRNDFLQIAASGSYWLFCGTFLLLFYVLFYVLVPGLYLRQKYFSYFSIIILLFAGVYLMKPFDRLMENNRPEPPPRENRPDIGIAFPPNQPDMSNPIPDRRPEHGLLYFDIVSVFLFMMIVAVTMAIQINRELHLSEKKAIKAETDRAEAELSFLKAQINPHFLFNTLNNIYTLAISSDPNTAESVMKLSNIMRYVTDDASRAMVTLQDEVDCLSDFIGLQKLRLGSKSPVHYLVDGNIYDHHIAPLILMSFTENVFKYGISKKYNSPVTITITADTNKIHFHTKNKIFMNGLNTGRTGIGIENTRKRLNYLYPSKHSLEISNKDGIFIVDLTLHS